MGTDFTHFSLISWKFEYQQCLVLLHIQHSTNPHIHGLFKPLAGQHFLTRVSPLYR